MGPGGTGDPEAVPRVRRSTRQRALVSVGAVLSVLTFALAAVVAWGGWKYQEIDRAAVRLDPASAGGATNYLVVGSDTRQGGDPLNPGAADDHQPLADTMMVVRVDPRSKVAKVLSLPRDLWVTHSGSGRVGRLNAAYGEGPQHLVDTIRGELGIPINHYVEVDFQGFGRLVGAIGGVPIWFDRAMSDPTGLDVERAGCVTLDARSALAFVRARHLRYEEHGRMRPDGTGDLGRISRQQLFLRRVIDRAKAKGVSNPLTLKRMVDVGADSLTLDADLSAGELVALGRRFASFDSRSLVTYTLPNRPRTTSGGASVVDLDRARAEPILALFRETGWTAVPDAVPATTTTAPEARLVDPADVAVTVLNGSGEQGVAFTAYRWLEQHGFTVSHYGNADEVGRATVARTEVRFAPGSNYEALTVARWVDGGAKVVQDDSLADDAVVLVLGRGFASFSAPTTTTTSTTSTTTTTVPPVPAGGGAGLGAGATTSTSTTVPAGGPAPARTIGVVPDTPPPGVRCG